MTESKYGYKMNEMFNLTEKPQFDESISQYQHHPYIPQTGQNALNESGIITIAVENSASFLHPAGSYLYIQGQIKKTDDTAFGDADEINFVDWGIFHIFDQIRYKLGDSQTDVQSLMFPGQLMQIKSLLKFSKEFKDQGQSFCLGQDNMQEYLRLPAGAGDKYKFSFRIPLKYIFNFCNDYNKVMFGMKHELEFHRKADPTHGAFIRVGTVNAKVVLTKLEWVMPISIPELTVKAHLIELIAAKQPLVLAFRNEQIIRKFVDPNPVFDWRLNVKAGNEKPRWIVIAFQTGDENIQTHNKSTFNHLNVTEMKVTLNDVQFPMKPFASDFTTNNYAKWYENYVTFRQSIGGERSGGIISYADFQSKWTLFIFDVRKQDEQLKSGVNDIQLYCKFADPAPANTYAYCYILKDRVMTFDSDGSKFTTVY